MMMRSLAALVTLLLVALFVVASRSEAIEPLKEMPESKVTTAYFNLNVVVKGYDRYKQFTQEMKEEVSETETKVNKLKEQMQAASKELTDPELTLEERKAIERRITQYQRRLEDTMKEGREFIGKKTDEELVVIYHDIQECVARYAKANGIEVVLHYNDAPMDTKEYHSAQNIARKMQAGALVPVYFAPGTEISDKILKELNARHHRGH
jgi:Skp family chaperone for outer membrane proteins